MATAAIMVNAANLAYRQAAFTTKKQDHLNEKHPVWMTHFADRLPNNTSNVTPTKLKETVFQRKRRLFMNSKDAYERLAWCVYRYIVNQTWFEGFVMCNIILIGVATGLDLENGGRSPGINMFVEVCGILTMIVFTSECVLKLISEAYRPQDYFLDPENGAFNTFDFTIVVAAFAFIGNNNGGAVGALRMLRLIRLLTFIKGVPQLRVIISGLIQGLKSVTYIVMLLFLIIYMFAIMGCLVFGANDPARFGTVSMSMVSLFQISTLSSWTMIAYTSWYGCGIYEQDQYQAGDDTVTKPSVMRTDIGNFEGYKCNETTASPATTFFFFHVYIVLTAWVILSLFIGVISMGMFEAFQTMKTANREDRYRLKMNQNMSVGEFEEDEEEDLDASTEGGVELEEEKDEKDSKGAQSDFTKRGQRQSPKPTRLKRRKASNRRVTLREKIDYVLDDVHPSNIHGNSAEKLFAETSAKCLLIREKPWFNNLITVTIIVVGVVIGMDTDKFMICERMALRVEGREDSRSVWRSSTCNDHVASELVTILSQIIFTAECAVKILAEGNTPLNYFNDRQNGSWNCLDFFVVTMGFIEMSPLSFIFNAFPVVILRLLRLLRVFRLAKALPRLRSIVEALISGFSAVGWICVLIVAFNYIAACMCMLVFQENDPFHFGSVGRSMFTILRIEALDTWDQILYLCMFGCEAYPAAYPLLDETAHPNVQCNHDGGVGWAAVFIFFVVVIVGSFILPTVLVGIITISFDTASKRAEALEEMNEGMNQVIDELHAKLPGFFTSERLAAIRDLFDAMDADGELTLDLKEVTPFYIYTFSRVFGVSLDKEHTEALFHLMDMNGDAELDFPEFTMFLMAVKEIEYRCQSDEEFRKASFPNYNKGLSGSALAKRRRSSWLEAIARIDQVALEEAWTMVFCFLGYGDNEEGANPAQLDKMRSMFEAFDVDGNMTLDVSEITNGLVSCGVLINERQSTALIKSMDEDGDGEVSFEEMVGTIRSVRKQQRDVKLNKKEADVMRALDVVEPGMGKVVSEIRTATRRSSESENLGSFVAQALSSFDTSPGGTTTDTTGGGSSSGGCCSGGVEKQSDREQQQSDNERSLNDVIESCVERIANRMAFECAVLAENEAAAPAASARGGSSSSSSSGGGSDTQQPEQRFQPPKEGSDAPNNGGRARSAPAASAAAPSPAVKLSPKHLVMAKTLRRVLKDRVLSEFEYLLLHSKGGSAGGSSCGGAGPETPQGSLSRSMLGGLVAGTLNITSRKSNPHQFPSAGEMALKHQARHRERQQEQRMQQRQKQQQQQQEEEQEKQQLLVQQQQAQGKASRRHSFSGGGGGGGGAAGGAGGGSGVGGILLGSCSPRGDVPSWSSHVAHAKKREQPPPRTFSSSSIYASKSSEARRREQSSRAFAWTPNTPSTTVTPAAAVALTATRSPLTTKLDGSGSGGGGGGVAASGSDSSPHSPPRNARRIQSGSGAHPPGVPPVRTKSLPRPPSSSSLPSSSSSSSSSSYARGLAPHPPPPGHGPTKSSARGAGSCGPSRSGSSFWASSSSPPRRASSRDRQQQQHQQQQHQHQKHQQQSSSSSVSSASAQARSKPPHRTRDTSGPSSQEAAFLIKVGELRGKDAARSLPTPGGGGGSSGGGGSGGGRSTGKTPPELRARSANSVDRDQRTLGEVVTGPAFVRTPSALSQPPAAPIRRKSLPSGETGIGSIL